MKREIKFRAWVGANGKMEYNDFYIYQKTGLCHYWSDTVGVGNNAEFYDCGEEEPVLMQFTGLKDKNGKEIYEGDIVDYGNNRFMPVEFINGTFCICKNTAMPTLMTLYPIIGNVYEHPELMSGRHEA